MVQVTTLVALAALSFIPVHAIDLDANSADSIKSAASTIASGLVGFYKGNETGEVVGVLDAPYFWWEAGAFFDTLIQYWKTTGDDQYNGLVVQGLQAQQGQDGNFMPANETNSEGNDDQATWALAAISAAEARLAEPIGTSWISLAEAVFENQAARWDTATCGGGLRWQIFTFNNGYNYKNSISTGDFFQLASRLARFTGNATYSDWADKAFNWTQTIGFIDENWNVFDGANTETNCTPVNHIQYSYVAGTFITGAAHMYNISSGDAQTKWKSALDGLLNTTLALFFPGGVANEVACEKSGRCTTDMLAFKGLLAHWLSDTVQLAPYTSQSIRPLITSSALAAAKACDGAVCPFTWNGTTGGDSGVGEQISALSFVQGLLIGGAASPVTLKAGASTGNSTTTGGSGSGTGTSPTATGSGTGAPSATGTNAAVAMSMPGMGMSLGLLGSMAWLML